MTGSMGQVRTHVPEAARCAVWERVTWDVLTYPPNIYLAHVMCHPVLIIGETATNQTAQLSSPCRLCVRGGAGVTVQGTWVSTYLPQAHVLLEQGRIWGTLRRQSALVRAN